MVFKIRLSQFSSDDSASAASSMEVTDRIASLEQRVQMQEDEIQLLKSALADVVRRLNVSEEQQAMGSRRGPTKGRTHTTSCCLMLFWLYFGASNCRKSVFFPPFPLCFLSFLVFPLLMSCHCPLPLPVCPLFSRPALLIALCVPRIDPAKLRKSPSADSSVGKSGRLIVKSCLHWAALLVVLHCVLK